MYYNTALWDPVVQWKGLCMNPLGADSTGDMSPLSQVHGNETGTFPQAINLQLNL